MNVQINTSIIAGTEQRGALLHLVLDLLLDNSSLFGETLGILLPDCNDRIREPSHLVHTHCGHGGEFCTINLITESKLTLTISGIFGPVCWMLREECAHSLRADRHLSRDVAGEILVSSIQYLKHQ